MKKIIQKFTSLRTHHQIIVVFGILLTVVIFSRLVAVSDAATATINPAADSYTYSVSPNNNDGASAALRVDQAPTEKRTYLKFTVGNVSGSITKVTFKIYAETDAYEGYNLYTTSNNWIEKDINFKNQPALGTKVASSQG
jgi:hypothetical protein